MNEIPIRIVGPDEVHSMDELLARIKHWGFERKITINGTFNAQLKKFLEELGELAAAETRDNVPKMIDGFGDVFVVLVMMAELKGINLHMAISEAWEEIKDRKGTLMMDGIFRKEGD